jgi:hypothetical protein
VPKKRKKMFRTIASLSVKVDQWESMWILPNETPIPICKEMIFQMQKQIAAVEDQIRIQQEAEKEKQEAENVPEEENEVVEIIE